MNKEIQNFAWSVLPKEFKEEVKKLYCAPGHRAEVYTLLQNLFGAGNLTSDAEGEEMLYVSRKEVLEMYADIINDIRDYNGENPEMVGTTDPILRERAAGMKAQLRRLFGSKCLPDENKGCSNPSVVNCKHKHGDGTCSLGSICCHKSPKPAEPKFKVGDKVRVITHQGEATPLEGEICEIIDIDKYDPICTYYLHNFSGEWYSESDLEPYTEPNTSHETPACENHSDNTSQKEVNMNTNRNLSKIIVNYDKQFDNILKDSFSKERRLNIAAMIAQGIMTNSSPQMVEMNVERVVDLAILTADTLIDECEKKK